MGLYAGDDQGGYLGPSRRRQLSPGNWVAGAGTSVNGPSDPTYDKGYALTDDATGDNIATGAKAAGSAFTTLASAFMGNKAIHKQKQINHIQREAQHKNYLDATNASLMNQAEGDRAAERQKQDTNSEFSAEGQAESSAKNVANSDQDHANDMRTWALRKQRADLTYGYENGKKIQHLQDQISRIQQQEAIIGAAIDSAVQVASIASDINLKTDIAKVDVKDILKRIDTIPVSTWRYRGQEVMHIGAMAQDFAKLGFGADPTRIEMVDICGALLAAVQALSAKVKELEKKNAR